jgi:antirestriction protein ArdC
VAEKIDAYALTTEAILKALESGVPPWHKPWKVTGLYGQDGPTNLYSKHPYTGISNIMLLALAGFSSKYWLTYRQAAMLGGFVKRGSKGFPVVFWSMFESKTEQDRFGQPKRIPFVKYSTVFNTDQVEGLPDDVFPKPISAPVFSPVEAAEEVLAKFTDKPNIYYYGNQACYIKSKDAVILPDKGAFYTPEDYYATLFHELAHATRHESRLDRTFDGKRDYARNSDNYAYEELVAELTAAYLCGYCGILARKTIDSTAAYLQYWKGRFQGDKKLFLGLAGKATKAANYILGIKREVPREEREEQVA